MYSPKHSILVFLATVAFAAPALRADDAPVLAAARRRPFSPPPVAASTPSVAPASPRESANALVLPPLAADVQELKFAEFFKMPVGPRGLEPGERLKSLDGQKVRLTGYFVFEDWSTCSCTPAAAPPPAPGKHNRMAPAWMKHVVPGRAMLTPMPAAVSLGHYDLCDDLPPQVAYLHIESRFGQPVFFKPGFFAVTGRMNLGNKTEPDARISFVRLLVANEADIVPVPSQPKGLAAAPFPDKSGPTTPSPTPKSTTP